MHGERIKISRYFKIIFTDIKRECRLSFGMLLGTGGQLIADTLGQLIGPIFKGLFDCLTLEDGKDRLSRNVGKQLPHHAAYHSLREKSCTISKNFRK
jgi:hypothetical protein